jgi:phage terminase large subunit GpA-like protein
MWAHIVWPEGDPAGAVYECPNCKERTPERQKAEMVAVGRWRATRPEVQGHAGFRLNALVSLLANATWGKLAAEFQAAKDDPGQLQTFVNTILGQGWTQPTLIDSGSVQARAEDFDLERIPPEVLVITAGNDIQDDRIETSIVGWTRDHVALVLGHFVTWGSYQETSTWQELDELLRTTWRHPHGGRLKVDAAIVDAGDGDHYDAVIGFCVPRMSRRIFAGKGMNGARPAFQMAKSRSIASKFAIIGIDGVKGIIFDRLQRGRGLRFSKSLDPVYFEQLCSERRVLRYARGMPVRRFERTGRTRNESLDCATYAFAARQAISINLERRATELRGQVYDRPSLASLLPR